MGKLPMRRKTIMHSEFESQLHAYHDDELDLSSRTVFEAHLAGCANCTAALAELRATSAVFAAAPREKLSQIALHRIHNRIDFAMERSLIRFAWSLSGVAAAVLVAGSIWLAQAKDPPKAAPPWVAAAVSAHTISANAESPAAQWYLADASSRSDDTP